MSEFYVMFAKKYFSEFFFRGGGQPPNPIPSPAPSPTPMAGPRASHELNPALIPYLYYFRPY